MSILSAVCPDHPDSLGHPNFKDPRCTSVTVKGGGTPERGLVVVGLEVWKQVTSDQIDNLDARHDIIWAEAAAVKQEFS